MKNNLILRRSSLLLYAFVFCLIESYMGQVNFLLNEDIKAHRRYWYYRARFINDFTRIGDEQGDCICFPERNYMQGYSTTNYAKVGPDQIDIINQYLSDLSLEYTLLKNQNQNTQETLKEIFYILKMYNRLDLNADRFWSNIITENKLISTNF